MRHYWGESYQVASVGIDPLGYVPEATASVLAELGISVASLRSKGLAQVNLDQFALIVNLTDYSLDRIIPPRLKERVVDWYVRDPYGGDLESYRRARNAIEWLVTDKIPVWLEQVAQEKGSFPS